MKIRFYFFCLTFFSINLINSQVLKENKVDDFTKHRVKRTSYETLKQNMTMSLFVRAAKIDTLIFIDIKMMLRAKVFSINEGDKLMFKLDNDSIVSLPNIKYTLACTGCGANGISGSGAPGITTSYVVLPSDEALLKANKITKVRIYTSDGYVEDDVKDKNAELIKNCLLLLE